MTKERKNRKLGPNPNHLKIDDENWESAVKRAIQKKKPKNGRPKKDKQCNKQAQFHHTRGKRVKYKLPKNY